MTILVNAFSAVSARLLTPWQGAWIADVDFDLAAVPVPPTGRVTLTVGTSGVLVGTIDDKASGRFGAKASARIVGGGNGWDKTVFPLHFHNDAGVLSTAVLSATAAQVGETVVDVMPERLDVDYVRFAGPASRVLGDRDWYVNAAGVTMVGPRVPVPAPPTVEIMTWEPATRRAELATDALVQPGMILVDTRFGTTTIRDVEQTFGADGSRATAWCSAATDTPGSRFGKALANLVKEAAGVALLKTYRYRVVLQAGDGRVTLQAVKRKAGVPDSVLIPIWYGVPGISALLVPGSEVMVQFLGGDPSKPVVVGFDPATQITSLMVGAGTSPVAKTAGLAMWATAVEGALTSAGYPVSTPYASLSASIVSTLLKTD